VTVTAITPAVGSGTRTGGVVAHLIGRTIGATLSRVRGAGQRLQAQRGLDAEVRLMVEAARLVATGAGRDVDATLDALAEQARRVLGTRGVSILLAVPGKDAMLRRHFHPFVVEGTPRAAVGAPVPNDAFVREAIAGRAPLFAADFRNDPRIDAAAKSSFPTVTASLTVPLFADDELVGALHAHWQHRAVFGPRHNAAVQTLASHAAIAIRTARLAEERAVAQEALRDAARLRGAILEHMGEALVLADADGRIVVANRCFAEMTGLSSERVTGRSVRRLGRLLTAGVGAERAARLRAIIGAPAAEGVEIVEQIRPERRTLEVRSTAVPIDGERTGRLFVLRDVTREHAVDRMKGEFVSLVSHELRTPLTSIKGYVELLVSGEAGDLGDDQREFLDVVKRNADRLMSLVDELLDISRMEAGKVDLRLSSVDLGHLVGAVAESMRLQLAAKGQPLRLDVEDHLPAVRADPDRITQIVTNLLSNAHKYTPAGGSIRIMVGAEGGCVRVRVEDSGIGLSEAEQAQLFTKFFRARNPTTQEVGGTGLGLAITKSLVEQHGGAMTVTSTQGVGSTFAFTLPVESRGGSV
jgi:PAS domain S-box-containing protein